MSTHFISMFPSRSPDRSSSQSLCLSPYQASTSCPRSNSALSLSQADSLASKWKSHEAIPHSYRTSLPRSDPSRYSRRQLSIEAVQCIHIEENSDGGGLYTFLVKPLLLQTGRPTASSRQSQTHSHCSSPRVREQRVKDSRSQRDDDVNAGEHDEELPELEPYSVIRPTQELLELSSRLLSSFEALLDPRRGGPLALTKEMLLSKRTVRNMFRRGKKICSGHKGQAADSATLAKIAMVNDFFLRVLRTGGEVLASSRTMQDFLYED